MHSIFSSLLWAQSSIPGVPSQFVATVKWLFVFGEPSVTENGTTILGLPWTGQVIGAVIHWSKVVGLFALLAWLLSWVVTALKTRGRSRFDPLDIAALVALAGCVVSVVLNVLTQSRRIDPPFIKGYSVASAIANFSFLLLTLWTERSLWSSIRRVGKVADGLVLAGLHLALLLGIFESYLLLGIPPDGSVGARPVNPVQVLVYGFRYGVTYMGFVVLARVLTLLIPEVVGMRTRRLFAIAKNCVIESTRRMAAPWVVIVLFGVILAFTHWFLPVPDERAAELGRTYVGTLTLLCMILLTVMVTILSPLSLPQDIQMQTIYTVVSKPVRRIELVLGRMIGYMFIVTLLVLLFGGISLGYLYRNIGRKIDQLDARAESIQATDPDAARFLYDQSDQLQTRMSARVPVRGSLSFVDSRGNPTRVGIDVGQEQETRSHIEGATPSSAIWNFGVIPDPNDPKRLIDRRVPVDSLLKPGSIEAIENRALVLGYGVDELEARIKQGKLSSDEVARVQAQITTTSAEIQQLRAESQKLQGQSNDFLAKATAADQAKKPEEAADFRQKASDLHSPPIPIEMTFTIYRTTKGRPGDPVYAEIEVNNTNPRVTIAPHRDNFPIREYYTNKQFIPARYLVGSLGSLRVTVRCMSPTQYLGMAESDFHILVESGNFGVNFFKGLFGIWLQAMVLTAIGVFAGTFLSWPVALLMTIAFFFAGHAAFAILKDFFLQTLIGGGPFESLIRLLSHDNQVNDLDPTLGVVVAKSLDAIIMPVMARMVYLIPNLASLDVSNTVAEGFAVTGPAMLQNSLVALGYAVPFAIGGYFILKNREVAA
jgi:ABC-type transport system involved in multi-copper enzyme maturation permease subunit